MILKTTTATLLQPAMRSRAFVGAFSSRQTRQAAAPLILTNNRRTCPATISVSLLASYSRNPFSTFLRSRAASEVSSKPASENMEHMTTNAKEEASAIASTIAKGIAGKGGKGDFDPASVTRTHDATGQDNSLSDSFVQLTSAIASTVPQPILVVGLAGALPYLGASLTTLYVARQASQAASGLSAHTDLSSAIALLDSCSHFQVTYGAVLISFLGALHWGMEFSKYGGYKGYPRLALGVVPMLAAWPTLAMEPQLALVAQWFIFTSLWYADMKATTAGWTPPWYSQYRFYLSILVGTCILGTLFGVNYLGPTTDVTLSKHISETGVLGSSLGYMDHVVKGEYEAVHKSQDKRYAPANAQYWTEEGDDGYVRIIKKKDEEEEEQAEGEGEDEEAKAEGDEKPEDSEEDGEKKTDDDSKDDGGKAKSDGLNDENTDQKNPRAGATGENMESAKKAKEMPEGRHGATKKDS